jgi:hypothetical protein
MITDETPTVSYPTPDRDGNEIIIVVAAPPPTSSESDK